jgi:hypothetical protein
MDIINKKPNYFDYVDYDVLKEFEYFFTKVNERTEYQFGLRDKYDAPKNDPALGETVEYFGFNILQDDRMRYIMENIVSLPDSQISPANKIGNTIISHFYGARGIHSTITGYSDPKKAHVDFERISKNDTDYLNDLNIILDYNKKLKNVKFFGTTELHTSLQTAARNFCRKKYNDANRKANTLDILEWIADWTSNGTTDEMLNVSSLKEMFHLLTKQNGVGGYYGYHCSTSNSVNPSLSYQHDEEFCIPGPGAQQSLNRLFPKLKENGKMPYGDLVIWIRENQDTLFDQINIHNFFHNLEINNQKIFEHEQDEFKVYGTEVLACQFGVYCHLKENPHKIAKRTVARNEDDSICDGSLIDRLKNENNKFNDLIQF